MADQPTLPETISGTDDPMAEDLWQVARQVHDHERIKHRTARELAGWEFEEWENIIPRVAGVRTPETDLRQSAITAIVIAMRAATESSPRRRGRSDRTATDRARELVADVLGDNEPVYDAGISPDPVARATIDALMADPDLLVDLVIEAGALEQIGTVRWHEAVVGSAWPVIDGPDDSMTGSLTAGTPVYRRTSTEASDGPG